MHVVPKVLLVDLNNFARYPSMSVGYLASVLRKSSHEVSVFAPLMVGVRGVTREGRLQGLSLLAAKLNHLAATSRLPWIRRWRDRLAKRRLSGITAHHRKVIEGFRAELARGAPQAVLISTYLMYRDVCEQICALCLAARLPVLIGGPYFVQPEVISEWIEIPGLTALIAGEVELDLPAIMNTLRERGDLTEHAGVLVASASGGPKGQVAPPLKELDAVPFPDYSDFPWKMYPNRVIPVITGRGCDWGVCSFCSDVTSSAGRTFRSRSKENVIRELSMHHERHGASLFVFTDLKLNSNVEMWRAITLGMQSAVPGAQWIGAVHVGRESDNGLSDADLRNAAKSGCVRLTTGLESGSQRLLDLMKKGTRIQDISSFLRSASSAGISCRCTMILGYPSETAEDVHASAEFLASHSRVIERVMLNRMQLITGTVVHRSLERAPRKFKGFSIVQRDDAMAQLHHRNDTMSTAHHRRAVMHLLREVHRINARPLARQAREFEGVM